MTRLLINIKFILVLIAFSACEEVTDWELSPGENQQLVVEAIITDIEETQFVNLSLSVDGLNDEIIPVSNAEVTLRAPQQTEQFLLESTTPGRYASQNPFRAEPDIQYILTINWEGKEYEATAMMGPVSPIDTVTFESLADTDSFFISIVAPVYHPQEQTMIQINLDWSHIIYSDSSFAQMNYYTFNTIDVSELVPPPKEDVYFPQGTFAQINKFGLSPEFAAYLRALVMETEWKGGVFDEAAGSLPTNISNGGLGWFAVCAAKRELVVVE